MINFITEQKLELKFMKIVLQRMIFKKLIIFVEYQKLFFIRKKLYIIEENFCPCFILS